MSEPRTEAHQGTYIAGIDPAEDAYLVQQEELRIATEALEAQEADMCPNCVTPWKCNGPHEREAATPPLDVERLARAIEIEDDRLPFLDAGIDSTASPRAVAEQIADRYARLPEADR